jgi:hypothetical protein
MHDSVNLGYGYEFTSGFWHVRLQPHLLKLDMSLSLAGVARSVSGSKRRHFIKKEELRIITRRKRHSLGITERQRASHPRLS